MPDSATKPIRRPDPGEVEDARRRLDEAKKRARELLNMPIYPDYG